MATLEELTERIRHAAASDPGMGKTLKLDLRGDGVIHIAGAAVTNEDKPADLVVTIAKQDLEAIGKGDLDPVRAMMSGRMRLSDMALAMQLRTQISALFERARG